MECNGKLRLLVSLKRCDMSYLAAWRHYGSRAVPQECSGLRGLGSDMLHGHVEEGFGERKGTSRRSRYM